MRQIEFIILISVLLLLFPFNYVKSQTQKREITILDIIELQTCRRGDISPDGSWYIYNLQVPDWKRNRTFSNLYITPIGGKTKRINLPKDRNVNSPRWFKDNSTFAFLYKSTTNTTQLFLMNRNGGDAWKVTNDKFGVSRYEWSTDWNYLTYLGGHPAHRQIWIMPGEGGNAEKLTNHKTPIHSYLWNPNNKKIYFLASDSIDLLDQKRKDKGFDVRIADLAVLPSYLWEIDIKTKKVKRLTEENAFSISNVSISDDGSKIAFVGIPTKKYAENSDKEVYILNLKNNKISQVTNNSFGESHLTFSPDSKWLAFISPPGQDNTVNLKKIYVVPTDGGEAKQLLDNFDYEAYISFWSEDSKFIYFSVQVGVDIHLYRGSIYNGKSEQITDYGNYSIFFKDKDSKKFYNYYSDPESPRDSYYIDSAQFNDKSKWIKLTDSNPQARNFQLSDYETINWTSTDGVTVEGILVKPINYMKGRKYPLIVDIHGGPHTVIKKQFTAYDHIYTAAGYIVFKPNYRGSTGYGEKFKKQILEGYYKLPIDDIMTGVDNLINKGIVHADSMGLMGWSAGGEYANWILVSTDRFKAISTGAGTVTFYDWENDLENAYPLKKIKNAKTPTLIHFGEYDRMMPPHHGAILYTALKKLEVPTEYIVYPNTGHGIRNMRYKMVKMQAEYMWFEKWIRGKEGWINWKSMYETLEKE